MPTEAEIEAAARAAVEWCKTNLDACDVSPICGTTISTDDEIDLSGLAIAALTAAEEVRGQVSEEDAELLDHVQYLCEAPDCRPYGAPTGETLTQADLRRLLALALRGAEQAVPDGWVLVPKEPNDAMAIAGECAPTWFNGMPAHFRNVWDAMLAAAPKPEGKP